LVGMKVLSGRVKAYLIDIEILFQEIVH